jgi:hypothetical protein
MAKIVLGMASSHGPTIRTPAEAWLELGKKDLVDPRFDYETVAKGAPATIDEELTLDRMKERHDNVQNARRDLSQVLADANPDVVIVISNLHGNIPEHAQQTFGVYIGDSIPKNERREDAAQAGRTPNEGANGGDSYATDVRLATHVHANLRESGFDIACSHDFPSSSGIGDAFTSLYPLF